MTKVPQNGLLIAVLLFTLAAPIGKAQPPNLLQSWMCYDAISGGCDDETYTDVSIEYLYETVTGSCLDDGLMTWSPLATVDIDNEDGCFGDIQFYGDTGSNYYNTPYQTDFIEADVETDGNTWAWGYGDDTEDCYENNYGYSSTYVGCYYQLTGLEAAWELDRRRLKSGEDIKALPGPAFERRSKGSSPPLRMPPQ